MAVVWLNTSIWHNRMVLTYLISLMPILVLAVVFLFTYFIHWGINEASMNDFMTISIIWIIIMTVWMIVGVYFQKQILFSFTWARELKRDENPDLYNIVENLCISKWIASPKVWIIDSAWLNAYATGWDIKNSWIVFSKWLIDTLDKKELEAVAGHELSHILNWDVKNMIIVNVFIWAISTVGYYMMKMWSWNSKWKNPIPLLWMMLFLVSVIALPFVNLAISRKKEYLADAWSAGLLQDGSSLISALEKISKNPIIESIDWKSSTVASMFIDNPKKAPRYFKSIRWMFSTHPSMEDRISMLKKY